MMQSNILFSPLAVTAFVCVCMLSCVQLFVTPWTITHQAPLSMGFSRQEYWSGLPFPTPGDLPNPGIELAFPALAGGFFTTEPPEKPYSFILATLVFIFCCQLRMKWKGLHFLLSLPLCIRTFQWAMKLNYYFKPSFDFNFKRTIESLKLWWKSL